MDNFGYEVKVIEDSITRNNRRLVTLQLRYPRFIHAEFMTHRVFSRNASSSRAIPVKKMIDMVRNEPATPIHWGRNQAGMQANEQLSEDIIVRCREEWVVAAINAANSAEKMNTLGLHKQVANRILEPFQLMHVVVTATEWENFFELRAHKDAQPEIQKLAVMIRDEMINSVPTLVHPEDSDTSFGWHLPYVSGKERIKYNHDPKLLCKLSAARCARVSYLNHDGSSPDIDKDVQLYERLVGSKPCHASPVEHQASPMFEDSYSGNFRGWEQFRKTVEREVNGK